MIWAVVPIKDIHTSKQRLSPVLHPWERQQLFSCMIEDVITALIHVKALDVVAVVSTPGKHTQIAERCGARWFPEEANHGHSAAIVQSAAWLCQNGVEAMLTITADVPLVQTTEIDTVISQHTTSPAVTIVPSQSGIGSNCLLCTPPDIIEFSFGGHSLEKHLTAAARTGVRTSIIHLAGIGLDIDTPEDLRTLSAVQGSTKTQRFLASLPIQARLSDYEHKLRISGNT